MGLVTRELPTRLPGLRRFVRDPQRDERGLFRRMFSVTEYEPFAIADTFVEDNISQSHHGVLRGLHFDMRLAKFVQVVFGEVFDAVVDVRHESPTFGKWDGYTLNSSACEQLFVPPGFAHGFYVLSEVAIVSYKQTAPYDPASEGQVFYADPEIGIEWPFTREPIVSQKDRSALGLRQFRP
jgi:dTDP-4-dehydrorhamnose 3,5-epimerase